MNKNMQISKKAFAKAILPDIGDIVCNCKVMYVKAGNFQFTAEGPSIPNEGNEIEWNDKKYIVTQSNEEKRRFSASFIGFKDFTVPLPVEQEEDIVKII